MAFPFPAGPSQTAVPGAEPVVELGAVMLPASAGRLSGREGSLDPTIDKGILCTDARKKRFH
jgi:hypothetical protein